MKQNNFIKTAAIVLLSVCTVFVITYFSAFFAVHAKHAEHACDSPDCSICSQLHMAGDIIKQLDQARAPLLLFLAAALAGQIGRLPVQGGSVRTLVSDKVRLNR